jgi:hypothetical protein
MFLLTFNTVLSPKGVTILELSVSGASYNKTKTTVSHNILLLELHIYNKTARRHNTLISSMPAESSSFLNRQLYVALSLESAAFSLDFFPGDGEFS